MGYLRHVLLMAMIVVSGNTLHLFRPRLRTSILLILPTLLSAHMVGGVFYLLLSGEVGRGQLHFLAKDMDTGRLEDLQ